MSETIVLSESRDFSLPFPYIYKAILDIYDPLEVSPNYNVAITADEVGLNRTVASKICEFNDSAYLT